MDEQLLDSEAITHQYDPNELSVGNGIRFTNYLIDLIIFSGLNLVIKYVIGFERSMDDFNSILLSLLLSYAGIFFYYFILEASTGKTVGKFITRTMVVDETGKRPEAGKIALRTLSRLIPFEAFSFLGREPRGWHDTLTNTWVVKDSKTQE